MPTFGQGPPLVLIPGIQGRWEWMRAAIDALSARFSVTTFSLTEVAADEACFDRWMAQLDTILDTIGFQPMPIVGVSFGGLIAYRYARRRPARV
jgi:pimeloyl-ACP methyl ester carboxylesterase